jgi:hypothetical protein
MSPDNIRPKVMKIPIENFEPMRTAAIVATEAEYSHQHRARLVRTPEFRQAMKFAQLHGLEGLRELQKAWIVECARGEDYG